MTKKNDTTPAMQPGESLYASLPRPLLLLVSRRFTKARDCFEHRLSHLSDTQMFEFGAMLTMVISALEYEMPELNTKLKAAFDVAMNRATALSRVNAARYLVNAALSAVTASQGRGGLVTVRGKDIPVERIVMQVHSRLGEIEARFHNLRPADMIAVLDATARKNARLKRKDTAVTVLAGFMVQVGAFDVASKAEAHAKIANARTSHERSARCEDGA